MSITQPNVGLGLISLEAPLPCPFINLKLCGALLKAGWAVLRLQPFQSTSQGHSDNALPYWNPNFYSVTDRLAVCSIIMNSPQEETRREQMQEGYFTLDIKSSSLFLNFVTLFLIANGNRMNACG